MKVLSLFDGMACGMLAMQKAGIEVDRYVAYEIDKYAVQTAIHNFPMIEQRGDVFQADFTEYSSFDFLIGGSPCTYWSIAQKNNRETEASGMGWELFSQYVRALHEAKPKFFVYENNKSMAKAIRESIDKAFGFEAIGINSALVSAQNRQRLYWVGKRNEDGTYSKVPIEQPEDLGILLKDVLESGQAWQDKSFAYTTRCQGATLHDTLGKHRHTMAAEPVAMRQTGRRINEDGRRDDYNESIEHFQRFEVNSDPQKTNCVSTVCKDNMVAEPVSEPVRVGCYPSPDGTLKNSQCMRIYSIDGKAVNLTAQGGGLGAKTGLYAIPVASSVLNVNPSGKGINGSVSRIDTKSRCLTTNKGEGMKIIVPLENCLQVAGEKCGLAIAVEWDEDGKPIKAISGADGKTYPVYEVKDGLITIKGKQYPIKLVDGFYIIRKLTVRECMRLQTVPEWYEFPVSDSQAYKMLGNGWTVDVITHLLKGCMAAGEPVQCEKKPQKVIVRRATRG